MVWYSHLFQNFPQFLVIHTVKDFDCVDQNKLWKILKEMGISDHLTCLLRNLYAGQEATVRTGHGTTDWFHDPANVVNLISGSSAFSKTSLNIWKFMVHVLLKPGLENFEHFFTSVWIIINCGKF